MKEKMKKNRRGFGCLYRPTYRDRSGERRESPTWWIAYSFRGKQHHESSRSTNQKDALRLLRRRLEEIGKNRLVGPGAERLTFDDLQNMLRSEYEVNGRKSLKRAGSALKALAGFFGLYRALDITTDRITAYIRQRQEAGRKPATIQCELAALKRMFTLAVRAEKLDRKPYIPSLEVHNARSGFFTEQEFRAVLPHLPDEVRGVVEFLWLTGWRKTEALTLEWSQVDWNRQLVRLEPGTTKNRDGRVFPFANYPELETLLLRQRRYTEEIEKIRSQILPRVLHRSGEPIRDFRKAWHKACAAANAMGRWVHDLRRSAVRRMEMSGLPRSVATKLTGHKTESIYRRYAVFSQSDLEEGVGKLAAFHEVPRQRKVVGIAESSIKELLKRSPEEEEDPH